MIVKKKKNNDYILTDSGNWVRDFTKNVKPVDINKLIPKSDYSTLMDNELQNRALRMMQVDDEAISFSKCVIVSDGFGFKEKQKELTKLPSNVRIIAVNRVLPNWKVSRRLDYYVVNNPYKECISYLPEKRFWPACISSSRTCHDFLKRYKGTLYVYSPTQEEKFSTPKQHTVIDDYRNPICAAIGLCYQFSVKKLALFCCDDVFEDERPAAEKLSNSMWMYPQSRIAHDLIDANLYWFKQREFEKVEITNHSMGLEYKNASYIELDKLIEFFKDE